MKALIKKSLNLPEDIHIAFSKMGRGISADDLHADERKEFDELGNANRQLEFLAGRALLKNLWKEQGGNGEELAIYKNEYGKPFGSAAKEKIYLSLAHTHHHLLCGISANRDIGVDLEPGDRVVDERLGKRMYHPMEDESIRNLPLLRLWTIKEALVKLYGGGLRTNLKDVHVKGISNQEFKGIFDNDKTAIICSFQEEKHWLSVAYYQKF